MLTVSGTDSAVPSECLPNILRSQANGEGRALLRPLAPPPRTAVGAA